MCDSVDQGTYQALWSNSRSLESQNFTTSIPVLCHVPCHGVSGVVFAVVTLWRASMSGPRRQCPSPSVRAMAGSGGVKFRGWEMCNIGMEGCVRVLDTYVMSQLRAEVSVCESEPTLHHLRVADGRHEIDLLVEFGDGTVFGFEIKASGAPDTTDARHLAWLRDELGDRFLGGAVLHTGPHDFPLGERIIAAPISALWTT